MFNDSLAGQGFGAISAIRGQDVPLISHPGRSHGSVSVWDTTICNSYGGGYKG